jgi:hypothetical protein
MDASLNVAMPATQHVEVRTSAVDRAKGYQIVLMPLALALGVLAVLVSVLLDNEFFSFVSLVIFWLTFVLVWLAGWIVTALATPEFVSWYSARRQWDIIAREQQERWAHYRGQAGPVVRPWWIEFKWVIVVSAFLWILLTFGLAIFAMVMWG